MRGDRVGVGDLSEVHGGPWSSRHQACGDDGRGAIWERDGSLLGGRGEHECGASGQQGRDRLDISDGARVEPGAGGVHGHGSGGAHGMRGDRVGVGDIREVHREPRSPWHPSISVDSGGSIREPVADVLCGHWEFKWNSACIIKLELQ